MHFHRPDFCLSSVVHWGSSWDLSSVLNHFVNSRNNVCSSTLEKSIISLVWGLLVRNYGMNFPDCKVDSFGKLILIVNLNPFFNKSSWCVLYVLWNLKGPKILLFHDHIIFSCLWWLSKLAPIGCLLSHFSEKIMCLFRVKIWYWESVKAFILIRFLKVMILLKSLLTSYIQNRFNNS